jgi:hypothetical protein
LARAYRANDVGRRPDSRSLRSRKMPTTTDPNAFGTCSDGDDVSRAPDVSITARSRATFDIAILRSRNVISSIPRRLVDHAGVPAYYGHCKPVWVNRHRYASLFGHRKSSLRRGFLFGVSRRRSVCASTVSIVQVAKVSRIVRPYAKSKARFKHDRVQRHIKKRPKTSPLPISPRLDTRAYTCWW